MTCATASSRRRCVLLLGNYPPPYGGVPTHIEHLAPALVADGFEVHVLSGGETGVDCRGLLTIHKYGRFERRQALIRYAGRNLQTWLRRFGSASVSELSGYLSLISLGRQIVRRHGVTVINAYNLMLYAPVGAVLSEEYNVPLAVSSFGEYFKHRDFFRRHARLVAFMLRQAAKRLSMTEHCATVYRSLEEGVPYEIVPYGIDVDEFRPSRNGTALRESLGISPADPVVLYLGRICTELGFAVFVSAVTRLLQAVPGLKVIIAGKPEDLFGQAIALAADYPASVFVLPDVSSRQLRDVYAAADVVAVPTLDDRACGSLTAAEAAASGKPVVASRVGGVPEFVREGETGVLVPPGEPEALAAALITICRSADESQRMGRAARLFAESHLDNRTTHRRIAEILGELSDRATHA